MSDLISQILLPLTLASFGLLALLTLALVFERLARNHRERQAGERRRGYEYVLENGRDRRMRQLGKGAARHFPARCDLVDALVLSGWKTGPVFAESDRLRSAAERDTTHGDVARRAVGVSLLAVIGGPEAVGLLVRLMREDPDVELRLIAARSLRVIGDDASARGLLGGLRDGVLPTARIVEQLGRPFAAHALLDAIGDPEYASVRADIAESLGLAGHVGAAGAIARLASTGDERERIKACRALGRLADPVVVPLLIRALNDDAWAVRAQAATALGACAHPSAVGPLATALSDHNWWVRANSANSLRRCGPAGLSALRDAAENHPDRYARDRAIEALALEAARSAPEAVAA